MKKGFFRFLSLLLVWSVLLCLPCAAGAEPRFRFELGSEGSASASAAVGDTLTVEFALLRTDSTEPWTMYAWQTEISFDSSAFELVDESIRCAEGVSSSIHSAKGIEKVFFNTYSLSASGSDGYPASLIGCSFRLKALKAGSFTITGGNNKVSTKGGVGVYPAETRNLTITVSEKSEQEETKKAPTSALWDGESVDVSWYCQNPNAESYRISTAAELAGAAALVNGLVNENCTVYTGSTVCSAADWNSSEYVRSAEGTSGVNNQSTDAYHYGVTDFRGVTLRLTKDLDMSAGNYMPIGGQYLMTDEDSSTKIDASFCGVLDGQGHSVTISCDRHCSGNYGDGQSVGLIGRLGLHDNEMAQIAGLAEMGVSELAVYGKVKGNRSVGGVVGKIGKNNGAVIEGCANFASVIGTDAKGTGGIVGAGWNGGIIRNCYNAGSVTNTRHPAVAGISGSNESRIVNCYNRGKITGPGSAVAAAIASENGGGSYVNCYWLDTSAAVGVYDLALDSVRALTAEEMMSEDFAAMLGDAFTADTGKINGGYPVFAWQAEGSTGGGGDGGGEGAEGSEDNGEDIPLPFSDIEGHWAYEAIAYVYRNQLFRGVSDTEFAPELTMTRAMLVTVLHRMAGEPAASGSNPFADVPEDAWYSDAVSWARENGIVLGYDETHFGPEKPVTREQMAVFLLRYADRMGQDVSKQNELDAYTDAGEISPWALEAVQWANAMGLITGRTETTLSPRGTATRAEVATILMRFHRNTEHTAS